MSWAKCSTALVAVCVAAIGFGYAPNASAAPTHQGSSALQAPPGNTPPSGTERGDAGDLFCKGRRVTIKKYRGTIVGTNRGDVILAKGKARIRALGGNDLICGSRFSDHIDGGAGKDTVFAGEGRDRVVGGAGRDRIFAEGGNDSLRGGAHRDQLYGGPGKNRYNGKSHRLRERQVAPDLIDDNDNVVDIGFSLQQLEQILGNDQRVAVFRQVAVEAASWPAIWQAVEPLPQNVVSWNSDELAVVASEQMLVPNSVMPLAAEANVWPSSQATYSTDGIFEVTGGGQVGAVTAINDSFGPTLAFGLAAPAVANGVAGPATAMAWASVDSYEALVFTPSDAVSLSIETQPTVGQIVPAEQLPSPLAIPSNGAALTIEYDSGTAEFVKVP